MKPNIDHPLRFWLECELDMSVGRAEPTELANLLARYESAGVAMRYVTPAGDVGWRGTPCYLQHLRHAEQDALADISHEKI